MYLAEYTGRGVRIAIIDSGVHALHPHVNGVSGGFAIREDGALDDDYIDRLGHGTAVAGAVREKAPDADLIAVKVFWQELRTDVPTLVRAIDEACARGASIVNLSLGTADDRRRDALHAAIARASARSVIVVAPVSLEGVVAVQPDWACPRDAYRVVQANGCAVIAASPYPRDIPGVPRERNLQGASFAVANATGFVARAVEAFPGARASELLATLQSALPRQEVL